MGSTKNFVKKSGDKVIEKRDRETYVCGCRSGSIEVLQNKLSEFCY